MKKTKKLLKKLVETHRNSLCNISLTCKKHGIIRNTFYEWMKQEEWFRNAIEENKEATVDFVESKLMKKISDEDTASIIFYLKTKGKTRGYIERIEQDQKTEVTIDFTD